MSELREAVRSRYASAAKQIALIPVGQTIADAGCCQADGPDCGCSGSYSADELKEIARRTTGNSERRARTVMDTETLQSLQELIRDGIGMDNLHVAIQNNYPLVHAAEDGIHEPGLGLKCHIALRQIR